MTGPGGALWRARKQLMTSVVTALLPSPPKAEPRLDQPLRVGFLRFDRRVGEVLLQDAHLPRAQAGPSRSTSSHA